MDNPSLSSDRGTVIITGAAGVIGEATAHLLSAQGYALMLVDTDELRLAALASALPGSQYKQVDVTDAGAVRGLFDEAGSHLHGVVLAAATEGPVGKLEDCDDADFDRTIQINVKGVWLCLKHALRILKPKKSGSIVVLGSISSVQALPMLSTYAASKHAVLGLVKTAAREAASSSVRVNAVCPGPVDSEMMQRIDSELVKNHPERLGGKTNAANFVPMGRYAKPEEVANAIAFLCSDESSYCSGTSLFIDGGLTGR